MYSVVLMTALAAGGSSADFHGHGCYSYSHACYGCWGGCHGCYGCSGYSCHGCFGLFSCHGYNCWSGCYGYDCYGCGCYNGCHRSHGCFGCFGLFRSHGCHGCNGCWGCYGCNNCCSCYNSGAVVPHGQAVPPGGGATPIGPPKQPPVKKEINPGGTKPGDNNPGDKKVNMSDRARIVVQLPADAKLYVDSYLTKSTSNRREFITPSLPQGDTYYYMLKAEMTRDGQTIQVSNRVIVRPGQFIRATLSEPASGSNFVVQVSEQ